MGNRWCDIEGLFVLFCFVVVLWRVVWGCFLGYGGFGFAVSNGEVGYENVW